MSLLNAVAGSQGLVGLTSPKTRMVKSCPADRLGNEFMNKVRAAVGNGMVGQMSVSLEELRMFSDLADRWDLEMECRERFDR